MKLRRRPPLSKIQVFSALWLVFLCVLSPLYIKYPKFNLDIALSSSHTTDVFGRPLFALIPYAIRNSVWHAAGAIAIGYGLAMLFGALWIFLPAGTRESMMRYLDLWSTIPRILWAFLCVLIFGQDRLTHVLMLTLVSVPFVLRMVSWSLSDRTRFVLPVQASISLGASHRDLFRKHIFPTVHDEMVWLCPTWITQLMLLETSLTYLGVGLMPRDDSMGYLLIQAREYSVQAPYLLWWTGVPFVATILALQSFAKRPYAQVG